MASTYTANQGIEKMDTGDQSGTWGGTVNTNMDIIDRAISGVVSITLTGSSTTLTTTDGTLTDGMYRVLVLGDSGSDLGSDNTITITPNDQDKAYLVYNNLSANRNAIFTQGTGANATIENGETAWIYADGGGSGAIVRTAVSSTKLLDQDGDTGIRVEEGGDDDDTIRFDIAGAEDFTMTANTFNVLSSSDLNINSGGTITNNGTATGFGADAERAFAGILEANATFVGQVIFGPAVDGRAWNGLWDKNTVAGAQLYTSLMLATVEDHSDTANTEVNIWDLTAQTAGAISTSAIGTVTLSGDATPTSIAASMGYLIVGSEDGISIIDPHSGTWAERTVGWPRTLSTSTVPVLDNASVNHVAAGPAEVPAYDPRTGGPMPSFGVSYGAGTVTSSILKDNGTIFSSTSNGSTRGYVAAIVNGYMFQTGQDENQMRAFKIDDKIADYSAAAGTNIMRDYDTVAIYMPTAVSKISVNANLFFGAPSGANVMIGKFQSLEDSVSGGGGLGARITRTYNTGLYGDGSVGVWLGNSKTADYSKQNNTLTENGTVTEGTVNDSGDVDADLKGYSGFSDSTNYLSRAFDADFDFGTGNFSSIIWFKRTGTTGEQYLWARKSTASGGSNIFVSTASGAHTLRCFIGDGSNSTDNTGIAYTASVWNQLVVAWNGALGTNSVYINGVLKNTTTNSSVGTLTNSNATLAIGSTDNGTIALDQGSVSLFRLFKGNELTPTQVRDLYNMEKGMFEDDALCLLKSGTTDACLDANVDPLTNRVIVTQVNKINIFDGLVNVSQPAVNAGDSELGNLWGDLRAEINSVNAYVTAPTTDQRQVNEIVRGLANDLPGGVDLSKAKAWLNISVSGGTPSISASYNIKSITDAGVGSYQVVFGIPFKSEPTLTPIGSTNTTNFYQLLTFGDAQAVAVNAGLKIFVQDVSSTEAKSDPNNAYIAVFGELENE